MKRLLIANRGEIAARIQKTAHSIGLETVAAYSDYDRHLPHLKDADETYRLGSALSYLDTELIIKAALDTNSDAIHPGYGFLSEDSGLSKASKDNKIIFVGPSEETLTVFGNKSKTRLLAKKLKIPTISGFKLPRALPENTALKEKLSHLTWPLMIKAAYGGGGKGMRIVNNFNELLENIKTCSSEALKSFSSGELLVEEALVSARHIEVQIVSDGKNYIHLFERDCSIQRRYQKIIEYAPAIDLNQELKEKIYAAAISICKEAKLKGLATVEFLVRNDGSSFYLLEVNPRIQVEHPVTEEITGLDLVKLQLEIADNKELEIKQSKVKARGFAVETRLCAENPYKDFLPQTGKITSVNLSSIKNGKVQRCENNYCEKKQYEDNKVRIDENLSNELLIGNNYDSLLAKLITTGKTINQAFENMSLLLSDIEISGLQTNLPFLKVSSKLLYQYPELVNTSFIKKHISKITKTKLKSEMLLAAIIAATSKHLKHDNQIANNNKLEVSLTVLGPKSREIIELLITSGANQKFKIKNNNKTYLLQFINKKTVIFNEKRIKINIYSNNIFENKTEVYFEGLFFSISDFLSTDNTKTIKSKKEIQSPVPGVIQEIYKKPGEEVDEDEAILVLESMKIEHSIRASKKSKIKEIKTKKGNYVDSGEVLVTFY